jgi:hypothetical protein
MHRQTHLFIGSTAVSVYSQEKVSQEPHMTTEVPTSTIEPPLEIKNPSPELSVTEKDRQFLAVYRSMEKMHASIKELNAS